jgi:hypothetical protein
VQGRKRRVSKAEAGPPDWPFYAVGIVGMLLLSFVQGLLIWNFAGLAPSAAQSGSVQSAIAESAANAAASDKGSLLDSYLSRKSQREISGITLVASAVMAVFGLAGVGAIFAKAGKPGWAVVVPVYNLLLLLKIAGRPQWWLALLLIPFVNLFAFLFVSIDVAHNFGKRTAYGLGLSFLGFVFYPLLGFGPARYRPYW